MSFLPPAPPPGGLPPMLSSPIMCRATCMSTRPTLWGGASGSGSRATVRVGWTQNGPTQKQPRRTANGGIKLGGRARRKPAPLPT